MVENWPDNHDHDDWDGDIKAITNMNICDNWGAHHHAPALSPQMATSSGFPPK